MCVYYTCTITTHLVGFHCILYVHLYVHMNAMLTSGVSILPNWPDFRGYKGGVINVWTSPVVHVYLVKCVHKMHHVCIHVHVHVVHVPVHVHVCTYTVGTHFHVHIMIMT